MSGSWASLSSPSRTVGLTVSVSASEVGPFGLRLQIEGSYVLSLNGPFLERKRMLGHET